MLEGVAVERLAKEGLLDLVRERIFEVSMILQDHGLGRVICPSFWHGYLLRQWPPIKKPVAEKYFRVKR